MSAENHEAIARGERMTGAQAVVRSLELLGVSDVFGLPGGAVLPLYDTLNEDNDLRHILVRHEQGGGHAAEGFAAASGKVGVCIATSGPGKGANSIFPRRRQRGGALLHRCRSDTLCFTLRATISSISI